MTHTPPKADLSPEGEIVIVGTDEGDVLLCYQHIIICRIPKIVAQKWPGLAARLVGNARALADTPPADGAGLETTTEERAEWLREAIDGASVDYIFGDSPADVARLLRDFDKEHARAEGLAKEVERLTDYVENNDYIGGWRKRAEAAEAKLAVYEAPVGDGGGEVAFAKKLVSDLMIAGEAYEPEVIDLMEIAAKEAFCRLSALNAQREGENTKLREALGALAAAVTEEVNSPDHRGGSGNLLARLSDARAVLSAGEAGT